MYCSNKINEIFLMPTSSNLTDKTFYFHAKLYCKTYTYYSTVAAYHHKNVIGENIGISELTYHTAVTSSSSGRLTNIDVMGYAYFLSVHPYKIFTYVHVYIHILYTNIVWIHVWYILHTCVHILGHIRIHSQWL